MTIDLLRALSRQLSDGETSADAVLGAVRTAALGRGADERLQVVLGELGGLGLPADEWAALLSRAAEILAERSRRPLARNWEKVRR